VICQVDHAWLESTAPSGSTTTHGSTRWRRHLDDWRRSIIHPMGLGRNNASLGLGRNNGLMRQQMEQIAAANAKGCERRRRRS